MFAFLVNIFNTGSDVSSSSDELSLTNRERLLCLFSDGDSSSSISSRSPTANANRKNMMGRHIPTISIHFKRSNSLGSIVEIGSQNHSNPLDTGTHIMVPICPLSSEPLMLSFGPTVRAHKEHSLTLNSALKIRHFFCNSLQLLYDSISS